MSKRKVCKKCRMFLEGDKCLGEADGTKHNEFATTFQGRVFVNIPETSIIAQKMGFKIRGEYAIKVK